MESKQVYFLSSASVNGISLPRQDGRVFFVTGGSSGVGFELCRILYAAGGVVYLAARSMPQANEAIERIREGTRADNGQLIPVSLQLDDLSSIQPAITSFLESAKRLDVLFNNAGVSNPPAGSKSAQGHELQMAVNCLAPYLLTQLLLPLLQHTASLPDSEPGSTRVVFTSSITVDLGPSPPVDLSVPNASQQVNYANTKMGNWFLANALQKQTPNVLSVTANPGNLKTALTRHMPSFVPLLVSPLLYHARFGAYTELWAGLSEELTPDHAGGYVVPWGRIHPSPRKEMLAAMRTDGGDGNCVADKFLEFCNEATSRFR